MLLPNTYYHIFNHANGFENLFREESNYSFFMRYFYKHLNPIAETYAYCLMPNHFHMLVRIRTEEELLKQFPRFESIEKLIESHKLSKYFANFFSSYTQSFNKRYKRRGSMFVKTFKRKEINTQHYLRSIILYIHLNPVHHGFTRDASKWRWSSMTTFYAKFPDLVDSIWGNETIFMAAHSKKTQKLLFYELDEEYTLELTGPVW
ncbi:MAG TPA: transposase [Bacteroidetes bacterium]|nr:transposase [Bacteroidota bacterium]